MFINLDNIFRFMYDKDVVSYFLMFFEFVFVLGFGERIIVGFVMLVFMWKGK